MNELWKRLYGYLPVAAQNAVISAYGLHYRRERFGPAFEPTVEEFIQRERWSSRQMESFLDQRLRDVLRSASETTFYRASWASVGLSTGDIAGFRVQDLPRLPVLTKQALRDDPFAFVPPSVRSAGPLLAYHSSGSTGTPIKALCTKVGQQRFAAAREARSYRWAGTSIRRPRAMIGGQPIVRKGAAKPPFYRFNRAERQVYFSAFHLSPSSVRNYVEGFNRHRPELVTGYAFSQFLLARLMREQGLSFQRSPSAAITSSEKLTPAMRQTIESTWGCRGFEEYGSVENCGLITECEMRNLHANPDFGIIEIVDENGLPLSPGVEGRIVCTALLNDAQFLVRYEIGDTASWSPSPCPCGRDALPTIGSITGRVEDAVVGPDGREMVRFHGLFVDLAHVYQGQVIQEAPDRFLVRVVPDAGFGPVQVSEIKRRFWARIPNVHVNVETATQLERTRAGKVRGVINRSATPSHTASAS